MHQSHRAYSGASTRTLNVSKKYAELIQIKETVWSAERARLAYAARDWFRGNDSATCRGCHEEASIQPQRKRGQRQHAEARDTGMTCIDCHYNLVHDEIEPRESFLDSAGTMN